MKQPERLLTRVIIEEDIDGRHIESIEYSTPGMKPVPVDPRRIVFLLQRVAMECTIALLMDDNDLEEFVNAAKNNHNQSVQ